MELPDTSQSWKTRLPANWGEALVTLLTSRVALIELEFRESAQRMGRRVIRMVLVAACLFFVWALLLVAGIALIAQVFCWSWVVIALGVAILHMVLALWLMRAVRIPDEPAFPVTRTEFQKDREWIENFQKTRKSSD